MHAMCSGAGSRGRSGACACRASVRHALHWGIVLAIALALCACMTPRHVAGLPWSGAHQLLLVVTPDWNSSEGQLRAFARDAQRWQANGPPVPVVIGRTGAAWGKGLHPAQAGLQKKEGDGRSPAGVFAIGSAFGYAAAESTALPYRALGADDYCVDVSGSPLYNRIVDTRTADAAAVAGSTEPMRRDLHEHGDQAYRIGFVIEHNAGGAAGSGSCIFVHLWKSAQSPTAGCTAMAEPALRALFTWLRPDEHPVFVLLPRAEYQRLRTAWQLPDLEER